MNNKNVSSADQKFAQERDFCSSLDCQTCSKKFLHSLGRLQPVTTGRKRSRRSIEKSLDPRMSFCIVRIATNLLQRECCFERHDNFAQIVFKSDIYRPDTCGIAWLGDEIDHGGSEVQVVRLPLEASLKTNGISLIDRFCTVRPDDFQIARYVCFVIGIQLRVCKKNQREDPFTLGDNLCFVKYGNGFGRSIPLLSPIGIGGDY
ncbi:hypothetical protein PMI28_04320 [Pseudomonas sp. GM48]|nr:hypothetical protein PMI28_04320 [Pseudomonas sp. GM48]